MNLEEQMAEPQNALDYQLLEQLAKEMEQKKADLDTAYLKWAELEM